MRAVYFEYDLDNGWQATFFLCPDPDDSNDWPATWRDQLGGPPMAAFAAEYRGFADTEDQAGQTVLLVARTLAALVQASEGWQHPVRFAAAYHDGDEVVTIRQAA